MVRTILLRQDLGALFPNASTSSVRALVRIYMPREQRVTAQLGSSCSYRLWANGTLTQERTRQRSASADDERVPLRLRAGWNTLLFQVTLEGNNDWLCLALQ